MHAARSCLREHIMEGAQHSQHCHIAGRQSQQTTSHATASRLKMHLSAQRKTWHPQLLTRQARSHVLCQLSGVTRTCEASQGHTTLTLQMSTGTICYQESSYCTACRVFFGVDAHVTCSHAIAATLHVMRGAVLRCSVLFLFTLVEPLKQRYSLTAYNTVRRRGSWRGRD